MARRPRTHERQVNVSRGITSADRAASDARRAECPYRARAARLRSSAQWQKVRAKKLAQNPLCERCEELGRTVVAQQVDHIVPIVQLLRRWPAHLVESRTPAEVFDFRNLCAICVPCHSKKSAEERRGSP